MSFEIMQFVLPHGAHTLVPHIDTLADGAVLESPASVQVQQLNLSMEKRFF
jgi:hypothetical protein